MTKPAKPTLWAEDKPTVTTIIPELAEEIGLNESLVLRQIIFWINTSDNLRDGEWWTYQSLSDMKAKAFPYFSIATLSRTVNKLVEKGLLKKTDKYNKRKNDRTQWFALNIEGASQLKTVRVVLQSAKSQDEKALQPETILHIETSILQNETTVLQNETTLPDYKPEYKEQKDKLGSRDNVPLSTAKDPVEKTEPDLTEIESDDIQAKLRVIERAGAITSNDYKRLKEIAPKYSLAVFEKAVEMLIERRNNDSENRYKGFGYLLTLLPDAEAQAKQQALVEASKPVIPYHKPAVIDESPHMSDEEAQQFLAEMRQMKESREGKSA